VVFVLPVVKMAHHSQEWAKWVKPCRVSSAACTNPDAKAANSVSLAAWLFSAMTANRRNRLHRLRLPPTPKRLKPSQHHPTAPAAPLKRSAGVCVWGLCQSFVGERFAQCYEGDGVISSITLADFAGFPDLKLENWVG
jgi:hypothetical protein